MARAALEAGATIINDVTGGRGDPEMLPLAAEKQAPALSSCTCRARRRRCKSTPHYDDVVGEVADFFRQQYARALECGIDPMAIAFDPGIGFGKTRCAQSRVAGQSPASAVDDRPIVVGVSRKSFLGKISGRRMVIALAPTVAFTALLRARGATFLRVHDVEENAAALRVTEAALAAVR